MNKKTFNANKRLIIQELETFLKELKLNCDSQCQLRYLANNYLSFAIDDIRRVIKELEDE